MPINIPPRKGLLAKRLAESNPSMSKADVARAVGTSRGAVQVAMSRPVFGRSKPKSRAKDA